MLWKYFKYCILKRPLYCYSGSYSNYTDIFRQYHTFPNYIYELYLPNGDQALCLYHSKKHKSNQHYKDEDITNSFKWILLGFQNQNIPQLKNCNYKEFKELYIPLFYPHLTEITKYEIQQAEKVINKLTDTNGEKITPYLLIKKIGGFHLF